MSVPWVNQELVEPARGINYARKLLVATKSVQDFLHVTESGSVWNRDFVQTSVVDDQL